MGSQKKLYNQLMAALQGQIGSAMSNARQENPYYTRLGQDATKFLNEASGPDVTKIQNGSFFNMKPRADVIKQSALMADATKAGQSALGTMPGSLMKLDEANRADENASAYASDYQDAVERGTGAARQTLMGLGGASQDRDSGFLSSLGNLMQMGFSSKPKNPWMPFLQAGVSALPSILAKI